MQHTEIEDISPAEKVVMFLMTTLMSLILLLTILVLITAIVTIIAMVAGWIWGDVTVTYWIADLIS
ncbi:MAG: hypothetical protein DU489_06970 [Nitrosomonas sp.]|uniref:hypothetical protein n=1 Tax=Nitrosomonas sp. TaxID=42353 RepID=UPI0032F07866